MLNSSIFYWAQSLHSIIFRWNDYIRFTQGRALLFPTILFRFPFHSCHWDHIRVPYLVFIVTLNRSSTSFLCQIFRSKNSWKRFYHHEPASSNVFRSPFNSNPQFLSHHHWGFYFYFICNLFMRSQSFVVNNSYLSSVVALCTGKDFMPNLFRFIKFLVLINTNTNKIDC